MKVASEVTQPAEFLAQLFGGRSRGLNGNFSPADAHCNHNGFVPRCHGISVAQLLLILR